MISLPSQNTLSIEGLSIGFDRRRVLSGVQLTIPATGIVAIMGPGGIGKSSLLRTLARWNEALPSFWFQGDVRIGERSLLHDVAVADAHAMVPLLSQRATLYTATVLDNAIAGHQREQPMDRDQKRETARAALEPLGLWAIYEPVLDEPVLSISIGRQRMLAIARLLSGGAMFLLADEPFRDLPAHEAEEIASLLTRWSERRAAVIVTHDQQWARRLCTTVCLMTAGRVVEVTPGGEFFARPRTRLGAEYVRSGNCWPQADEMPADPTAADAEPEPAAPADGAPVPRPGGFHWVIPERLGGMQRPGLLRDEADDLAGLHRLGCRVLVTLTEKPYHHPALDRLGIRSVHFPIDDMGTPTLAAATDLIRSIVQWIDEEVTTVLHCRAGLGRTGTMLACVLVCRGDTAVTAIEEVRSINPYYIQSREQLEFLTRFEAHLAGLAGRRQRGASR